jgi:2-C-methyl-D-erythritol 4-phosphate cytidylyltransferase
MKPICTAVIVAAGKGKRMGTEISKQFLPLCGKEILSHTVEKFEVANDIRDIVLVTGQDSLQDVRDMVQEYNWKKVVSVAAGGKERQDSVWNGLQAVSEDTEIVLIHDGVRPFVTEEILNDSIETAMEMGGCVAGIPAKDTIKVCNEENIAVATPDRSTLWQIQTPQTFRKGLILQAYAQAEGIIPEPAFLHCKTKIVRWRRHSEVQIIALGPDVHVRLQLPAAPETKSVIQGKEEHRS